MNQNITEHPHNTFRWIDVCKPSESQLEQLAADFELSLLPVSDSMQHGHLPKFEKFSKYNFIILRAYTANETDNNATIEGLSNKVAFFYNQGLLITIHQSEFDFIKEIKKKSAPCDSVFDLLLLLTKEIIESYIRPSQWQLKQIDAVENAIFLEKNAKISLEDLYFQKAESRISKKLLVMTQRVLAQMQVPESNSSQFHDIKDDLIRLILDYDEVWEDANNLMNTYLSVAAQKNNDVVRLLTVFSAFFLPLTFIAGIYGMNFHLMPELHWRHGYLFVLLLMAVVCIIIYTWFKRKKIM